MKALVEGLWDAEGLALALDEIPHGLLVHGHLHRRVQRNLATRTGEILAVGATSASLNHEDEHRMAGFNLYEFDGGGALQVVEAHVYDPDGGAFRVESVPKIV
jgi:hypothetical protein